MSEATKKMPIVALRGMTVLPKMLIHFDIKRKVTVRAINEAMSGNQKVLLLTQIILLLRQVLELLKQLHT